MPDQNMTPCREAWYTYQNENDYALRNYLVPRQELFEAGWQAAKAEQVRVSGPDVVGRVAKLLYQRFKPRVAPSWETFVVSADFADWRTDYYGAVREVITAMEGVEANRGATRIDSSANGSSDDNAAPSDPHTAMDESPFDSLIQKLEATKGEDKRSEFHRGWNGAISCAVAMIRSDPMRTQKTGNLKVLNESEHEKLALAAQAHPSGYSNAINQAIAALDFLKQFTDKYQAIITANAAIDALQRAIPDAAEVSYVN